jgi:hypothetical protein
MERKKHLDSIGEEYACIFEEALCVWCGNLYGLL